MTDMVRWELDVSKSVDRNLRAFLAERGKGEADIGRFIEDAVRRQLYGRTLDEVHAANADLDEAATTKLVDEEMAAMRAERRAGARR